MKIKVGISNRHVHLCEEDYRLLFHEEPMQKERDLTQPGEYASDKFVTLKTKKNKIERVRVLGPLRPYTQVEISKTDAYFLGLNPPVRDSSDLEESEDITILGTYGELHKESCCIIAARHIHVSKEDAPKFDFAKECFIKVKGEKEGVLGSIHLKRGNYTTELHLDTDDGNAFFLKNGDEVEVFQE